MKHMIVINLHEIDFVEQTLTVLAQAMVTDCTVHEVESIPSHHAGETLEPTVMASIAGLFKQVRNINYLILAVLDEDKIEMVTEGLKRLYKEDRYASSFWFIPIHGYFYHKQKS
ncbi:MAG: hypothetical protein D6819_09935 [Gammaproteobacteria bacterium]|nr:MAG: hypothetical protein D6819_09935 [Gammaproteobacteria bacterium]